MTEGMHPYMCMMSGFIYVDGWVKANEVSMGRRLAQVREVHAQLPATSQGDRAEYAKAAQGQQDFTALMLIFNGQQEVAGGAVLKAMIKVYGKDKDLVTGTFMAQE